ncbi:MAG TPA: extracellular solute-binding protein [Candidatus Sulfotelmatobacter sp.]
MSSPLWLRGRHTEIIAFAVGLLTVFGTVVIISRMGDEEERLTIAVKQGAEGVALKEVAENFSRSRHLPVEVVELPYDELYEAELKQLQSQHTRMVGSVPRFDVIMVDDPWMYSFAYGPGRSSPRLKRLNSLFGSQTSDFVGASLDVAKVCLGGKPCSDYFGVPFVANSQLFAYRPADFSNAPDNGPSTWDDVCAVSLKVRDRMGYVTRIGAGNSIVTDFLPILWAYDPTSLGDRSVVPLHHPYAALDVFRFLVGSTKNLGNASFDDFDVSAYLQKGRTSTGIIWSAWAMMLVDTDRAAREMIISSYRGNRSESSLTLQNALLSQRPDSGPAENTDIVYKERLIFSPLPQAVRAAPARPELGVWLLAIPADSRRIDLAREFIRYATDLNDNSGARQLKKSLMAAHSGTPPPRKSVLAMLQQEHEYKYEYPSLLPQIRYSLEHARPRPRTACWKQAEKILGSYLERMVDQPGQSSCAVESCSCTNNCAAAYGAHSIACQSELLKEANRELAPLLDEGSCDKIRQLSETP